MNIPQNGQGHTTQEKVEKGFRSRGADRDMTEWGMASWVEFWNRKRVCDRNLRKSK